MKLGENPSIIKGKQIASGSTKNIYGVEGNKDQVIIEETDNMSAGNGARIEQYKGKGQLSSKINALIFDYLNSKGIATHFIQKLNSTENLVQKCEMIPVECVYRKRSAGSYNNRQEVLHGNKKIKNGDILEEPIVELFYKKDIITSEGRLISDPLIQTDKRGKPNIDERGKLTLLDPDTGKILEYNHLGKKSKNFPQVKATINGKEKIIKKFRFEVSFNELETKSTTTIIDDTGHKIGNINFNVVHQEDFLKVYDDESGQDITKEAAIAPDMVKSEKVPQLYDFGKLKNSDAQQILDYGEELSKKTKDVFETFQELLAFAGIVFIDGKGEFGINSKGEIVFSDGLDGDSCRLGEQAVVKGEDGNSYIAKEFNRSNLNGIGGKDKSFWEKLDTINSNKEIKEIIAIRKLDKDGYRSGGKIKATIEKYKRLLSLLQEALKIKDSQSIEKTQDFIKEKILNIG